MLAHDEDGDAMMNNSSTPTDNDEDPLAETAEDDETRPQFHYRAGYLLEKDSPTYIHIHKGREEVGHLLVGRVHRFRSCPASQHN